MSMLVSYLNWSGPANANDFGLSKVNGMRWPASRTAFSQLWTVPYLWVYSSQSAIACATNHHALMLDSFAQTVQGCPLNAPLSVKYGVPSFLCN